eukprot:SRR837773.74.p3 GENE.SRR837773.74~~SRR837773.74.p3  ORF type:complete len:171 (-),score=62.08 SRR837773.74:10-471(-)
MAAAGFASVVHVDGSGELIAALAQRDPALDFRAVDARALGFANATFDLVVEKGLLDALMLGSRADAVQALLELHRVLRPGGRLLSVTMYGGPGEEGPVLGEAPWRSLAYQEVNPAVAGQDDAGGGDGGGVAAGGAYLCRKASAGGGGGSEIDW